ncbi:MAG: hypothetical protein JRJ12_11475 [Deltaproteobacteria bacterium]|nr:hypothetical protein [Deltaproteobacteria bacterium]MBW2071680.1 hypothetical protein [Deltaproteobacteria bacterium]
MEFEAFFERCQSEPTVSDFESYLSFCIFERRDTAAPTRDECSLEMYSYIRDQAFEGRDEQAARLLYELSGAKHWQEGEWEGALR